MAKYVKGKDGKFKGSIGDGKTRIPTAAQQPVGLTKSLVDLGNTQNSHLSAGFATIHLEYDPIAEAENVAFAMGKGGSFSDRRARKQLRKSLEQKFGAIDWSASADVTIEDDQDPFNPGARVESAPVQKIDEPVTPRRQEGTDKNLLRAMSGNSGVVWVRTSEEGEQQFVRAADNARMLHQEPGSLSVDPNSEWFGKEHVLIQYGTYAQRYNIGDVSFSTIQR